MDLRIWYRVCFDVEFNLVFMEIISKRTNLNLGKSLFSFVKTLYILSSEDL